MGQDVVMSVEHALKQAPTKDIDHLVSTALSDKQLRELVTDGKRGKESSRPIEVTGEELTIAQIVAVAYWRTAICISPDKRVRDRVDDSVSFLTQHLDDGNIVYGINTGYGGSADTRSADFVNMQRALIQHHNSGILLPSEKGFHDEEVLQSDLLSNLRPHHLPRAIVRGSMLARCNSLLRGHSAVRLSVIENIAELLNKDFIPIIPLRGSISASGDLTPLAYIAGALEGNPNILLDCRVTGGKRKILTAQAALCLAGLRPSVMLPKEGLGLMNGTAVSTAAASLALYETRYLALAAQVLTGMCTEALHGSVDNYHPFISRVRPHHGQSQVAQNVQKQLVGSKITVGTDARTAGLFQDRYALRTSPQWIGPQLEDLMLAEQQVSIELNSTTDNPLVDAEERHVHHGGNFQATSVTSAMEKTRTALQMLGKIMFAQSSELINPMLNGMLSPNLCFDDPDTSFSFKGVDINMAAYMSELAYLANPVSSHVQSAEMHNQAVNSLALISTRYTMDAIELVSMMTATYMYTVCQALDLHVLYIEYMTLVEQRAGETYTKMFGHLFTEPSTETVFAEILDAVRTGLSSSKSRATPQRAWIAAEATIAPLTAALLRKNITSSQMSLQTVNFFTEQIAMIIETAIKETRARFAKDGPTTKNYLGHGSSLMYSYIRETLAVPLHRGLVEHPTYPEKNREEISMWEKEKVTTGSRIEIIYEALRTGKMSNVLIESLSY